MNKNKLIEYNAGKKVVYFVGRLTKDFPFLVETKKGKMMTPFLYGNDDDGYGSLIGEKYLKIEKNKKVYIEDQTTNAEKKLSNLSLISIAINGAKETKYLPVVFFDQNAKEAYKNLGKGDLISGVGTIVPTKINKVGTVDILWVDHMNLIQKSMRNIIGFQPASEEFQEGEDKDMD